MGFAGVEELGGIASSGVTYWIKVFGVNSFIVIDQ
jgi:hypothetical protein